MFRLCVILPQHVAAQNDKHVLCTGCVRVARMANGIGVYYARVCVNFPPHIEQRMCHTHCCCACAHSRFGSRQHDSCYIIRPEVRWVIVAARWTLLLSYHERCRLCIPTQFQWNILSCSPKISHYFSPDRCVNMLLDWGSARVSVY